MSLGLIHAQLRAEPEHRRTQIGQLSGFTRTPRPGSLVERIGKLIADYVECNRVSRLRCELIPARLAME